jgi:hypothetical protein
MRTFIAGLVAVGLFSGCSGGDSLSPLGKVPFRPQAKTLSSISFKYQTVDNPASSINQVNGINGSGDIVGTTGSGSESDPYESYISQAPYETFQDETYKNAQGTVAMNINNAASQTIVGGWVINPPSLPGIWAFVQIDGLWTIFRDLKGGRGSGTATEILGINDEGFGVGYFKNTDGYHVPVLINIPTEKFTTLKPPGYSSAQATGINNLGDIAGWETGSSGTIGFFERIGRYYTLSYAKAQATYALGINSSDQIVGYYTDSRGTNHGFILTNPKLGKKWQTIDEPDAADGTVVTGINDYDEICGYYVDASGIQHGFVATPTPKRKATQG